MNDPEAKRVYAMIDETRRTCNKVIIFWIFILRFRL